ncbi:21464_t:CDS:2, partial [Gigaspora rosea]
PELNLQVHPKPIKKDKLLEAIFKIINEITSGRIIIYCAMPDKCIDIVTALKGQYNLDLITTYHGKMSSVYIADVSVIIHATFPISITNLVQEIGRAACDSNPGKSIIFYSRSDIRRLILIKAKNKESFSQDDDFAATIFESSYYLLISECNVCDNCIRRSQDKAVRVNVYNDLLKMLNVTEKLLRMVTERKLISFGKEELVDVFLKAENKNTRDKNLSLFWNEEKDASYKPNFYSRCMLSH